MIRTVLFTVVLSAWMPCYVEAQVQSSGSDGRSQEFNNRVLPLAQQLIEKNLENGRRFENAELQQLASDKLFLRYDSDKPVRIYFVTEDASNYNALKINVRQAGPSNKEGREYTIFPNASIDPPILSAGDFVEIGHVPQGYWIDPFIISTSAEQSMPVPTLPLPGSPLPGLPQPSLPLLGTTSSQGGGTTFYTDPEKNPDKAQHVIAFTIQRRYVLIGFEDAMNHDADYNDVLFVIDLGANNGRAFHDPDLPH